MHTMAENAARWRFGNGSFFADQDGYEFRVTASHSGAVGVIYRDGTMVHQHTYRNVNQAMEDIALRVKARYFVSADSPDYTDHYTRDARVVFTTMKGEAVTEPAPEEQLTDEEPGTSRHKITLYLDEADGKYRWHRKARNGEIISDSANHGYIHKRDALHGLRLANQDSNYDLIDTTKEDTPNVDQ